ncbi:MAG: hypothetical protein SX243_22145 [Acidobacteriota bacterium]|nr:hypothetical protein [Acidobacteriota bacterium]
MNRLIFICFSLSCLALTSLLAPTALGQAASITFEPPRPHDGEAILVTVMLPGFEVCDLDPAWSFDSTQAPRVDIQIREECLAPPPPGSPQTASFEIFIGPLPAGTFTVRVLGSTSLPLIARPVRVGREGSCVPSQSTLCLQRGRFQVRALYATGDQFGPGRALPRTEESGYYTFFDRENVELVVKILDGCNTTFNSYWLFTAGLTNVGVELQVTDTVTGQSRSYFNPERKPYPTILDTRAMPVCP